MEDSIHHASIPILIEVRELIGRVAFVTQRNSQNRQLRFQANDRYEVRGMTRDFSGQPEKSGPPSAVRGRGATTGDFSGQPEKSGTPSAVRGRGATMGDFSGQPEKSGTPPGVHGEGSDFSGQLEKSGTRSSSGCFHEGMNIR